MGSFGGNNDWLYPKEGEDYSTTGFFEGLGKGVEEVGTEVMDNAKEFQEGVKGWFQDFDAEGAAFEGLPAEGLSQGDLASGAIGIIKSKDPKAAAGKMGLQLAGRAAGTAVAGPLGGMLGAAAGDAVSGSKAGPEEVKHLV